jgi:hypothetical protein
VLKAARVNERRIDRILSRGEVTADRIEIVMFSRDGQFPID